MPVTGERPADEDARMEAVRRYDVLDTPPDGAFDRVTALAARFCDVPIATITIVDEDRIWFKSTHGIEVDEVGRDPGLCASAIMNAGPYVVTDASVDPRALNNPLVRGELGLRFYAGIPLTTEDGHNLGTLNVIDVDPRELTAEQLETLEDLAAVVMDELELRMTARRTVELETARESAAFRESLLAGISHEMRTAIAILHGTISLETDNRQEADQIRAVQRRHVTRLGWLINQYLDFTTLEAGRDLAVNVAPIGLAQLVTEAVEVFTDDADIDLDIAPDLPPVYADADRTRQIVMELVNNADRFSPADAPIGVRAQTRPDGTVGVTVTDQGSGIAPSDHDRVFDKTYRSGDSTGSGIGLYVAHQLAEAQDGRLEFESEPRHGSSFTLVLASEPPQRPD